jgi:hypothetical protein
MISALALPRQTTRPFRAAKPPTVPKSTIEPACLSFSPDRLSGPKRRAESRFASSDVNRRNPAAIVCPSDFAATPRKFRRNVELRKWRRQIAVRECVSGDADGSFTSFTAMLRQVEFTG